MSFFGLLFLFLIIWFVVRPIINILTRANRMTRAYKDAVNNMNRRQQQQQQQQRRHRQPQRKKRIDPEVGEYVDFTEVTTTETTQNTHQTETKTKVEDQITDVTWEDL